MQVNNRATLNTSQHKLRHKLQHGFLYGVLACSPAYSPALIGAEQPSLAFLEYLGSEESKIDNKWSSPVDLDIEQYLMDKKLIDNDTTKNSTGLNWPAEQPSAHSEDDTHE